MEELVVIANDRVGLLADISEALAKKSINIEGIDVQVAGKKSICRVMIKKADSPAARKEIEKMGFKVLSSEVLVLKLADKPGELSGVARRLADNGVNIKNVHLLGKSDGFTLCALETDKEKIARELLAGYLQ